ncbi:MAG: Hsp20 family protein [Gammaproteobacteria bacterium]|nr:Hsp20 family protein [Gammaproteobacteria bacterium]
MNLEKLNPWNWFQHEEEGVKGHAIPVTRDDSDMHAGLTGAGSLFRLHRDMDRWFDDALNSFGMPLSRPGLPSSRQPSAAMSNFFRPQIDVSADDNSYEIALDVPDMSESDISVEVKDDMLLIKGQKEDRREDQDKHFYRVERSYGSFQRTLALPGDANADEIKADLEKGVLRLQIPRRETTKQDVRHISISS